MGIPWKRLHGHCLPPSQSRPHLGIRLGSPLQLLLLSPLRIQGAFSCFIFGSEMQLPFLTDPFPLIAGSLGAKNDKKK
jgi:hypothetical protein